MFSGSTHVTRCIAENLLWFSHAVCGCRSWRSDITRSKSCVWPQSWVSSVHKLKTLLGLLCNHFTRVLPTKILYISLAFPVSVTALFLCHLHNSWMMMYELVIYIYLLSFLNSISALWPGCFCRSLCNFYSVYFIKN